MKHTDYMSAIPEILYEDNHLLIVNKRPGDIVQGDKTGDVPLVDLLKEYLKKKYNKPGNVFLGLVHRLDRPTSGIVVFARTSKALSRMNELFKSKQVNKTYWALVKKAPPEENGSLRHFLKKNNEKNKSFVVDAKVDGAKEAILHYAIKGSSKTYTLVEVELETGRHHQIRVQLSHIGCPIKGDLKYGFPRSNPDASISLHSRKISFVHPVKKELLELEAPPPGMQWEHIEFMAL